MYYEVIIVIVTSGKGSKIIKEAKPLGVTGATVFLGTGSHPNPILKLLELDSVRKEIVMMVTPKQLVESVLEGLTRKFHFDRHNHGIAFTLPLSQVIGISSCKGVLNHNDKPLGGKTMYKAIITVVDRGKAEAVIESARCAGAKGGTIINGRGSGIHEKETLFSFPIEPEKEIVLIISQPDQTETIIAAVCADLKIEEPGMGILFVLDVNEAYGIIPQ